MEITTVADRLDDSVELLQMVVAGLLVVLLVLGVLNLAVEIGRSIVAQQVLTLAGILGLISSSIDIVLYLFIVVELYKTIIAYVEAESVVLAVIHAGLIAVVRQIITFQPDEYEGLVEPLVAMGTQAILLLVLLAGFWVVHRRVQQADDMDVDL